MQTKVELGHDIYHMAVQELYGIRWSLKAHPQPGHTLILFTVKNRMDCVIRAYEVAAVENAARAAFRKILRDHRELEIRRRDLELVVGCSNTTRQ